MARASVWLTAIGRNELFRFNRVCKVHSTSSLKIRQFAAFCGLFESWNSSRSSPTGPVSNNTDENNTVHFGGDQDTYDFYLKVLDALAPNGHVSSLFPENESANGKAIRCSEVQSNKTAGSTIKMMNFDDSGKVTFSHACAAVKALFSNVLVNERTSVKFNSNSRSNNNNNNNNNNRLTEKEKMDALARAFLFHRGLENVVVVVVIFRGDWDQEKNSRNNRRRGRRR